MEKIEAAGALAPQPPLLYDEKSSRRNDVYIAVSSEVPKGLTRFIARAARPAENEKKRRSTAINPKGKPMATGLA